MDLVNEEVANRLELVRKEFGYSYNKMADIIGHNLKGDTLRKSIDRGRVKKIYVLSAIHKLSINSDWMFHGNGVMKLDPTLTIPNIYLEKEGVRVSVKEILQFLKENKQILSETDDDYKYWLEDMVNSKMFQVFRDNNVEFKVIVSNEPDKQ